jgi:hypothetical protein
MTSEPQWTVNNVPGTYTPGSPKSPLLPNRLVAPLLAEPATRSVLRSFFAVVSLPAGRAGLRRQIALALRAVLGSVPAGNPARRDDFERGVL